MRAADQEGMDMINAAAAGAHRFGRVKRNGYDPAEVDAVVSRLVDQLGSYETKLALLEERLEEADASADAIRKTFVAAESTRTEIIETAKSEAETIVADARSEADTLLSDARTQSAEITASAEAEAQATAELATKLEQEIARQRDEMLGEAQRSADEIVSKAETDVAERLAAAAEQGDRIVGDAEAAAEEKLRVAAMEAQALTQASNRMQVEAIEEANALLDAASEEAIVIRSDAEHDSALMQQRMAALRAAVVGLEESARHLAAITAEEASVIDLAEIEAIDEAIEAESDAAESEEAAPLETHDDAVDEPADEPAMATVGAPEAEAESDDEPRPLLSVAEATAEMEREEADQIDDIDESPVSDPGPATYYQRSTGTPLSERVKIARKSG